MANRTFYEVLTDAVDDFITNGFDSQERLDRWLALLAEASRRSLVPPSLLQQALRSQLTRIFTRETSLTKLVKRHRGVSTFTLRNVKPKLRAALDRRILASANLIKLNRKASIARTLQRFAGWASSVPKGGTEIQARKSVKDTVRRSIAALPFEERRVIIDQGHKLVAAVNDIIATDGGAIALIWHHVKEGPPMYDARPDHVARDGKVYLIRDSWAHKKGLVKPDRAGYSDEITQPGEEVFCRCHAEYLYALRDLPADMLTVKGQAALAEARRVIRGTG